MPFDDLIIRVYCLVEESLQDILGGNRLRRRGFEPALSDAEVLTMEFVGAYRGLATDKVIWMYFREHWQSWFPQLSRAFH